MTKTRTIHANLVEINGRGLLITGESGSGKTSLTLDLVSNGAKFVADDAVVLEYLNGTTLGCAPDVTRGLIAINDEIKLAEDVFGVNNIATSTVIAAHIDL